MVQLNISHKRPWLCSYVTEIGPGKNGPAGPILDSKNGPGDQLWSTNFGQFWYPKLVRLDQNRVQAIIPLLLRLLNGGVASKAKNLRGTLLKQ